MNSCESLTNVLNYERFSRMKDSNIMMSNNIKRDRECQEDVTTKRWKAKLSTEDTILRQ